MLKRETWFKLVVVSAVLPACGDGGGTTVVTGATEATEPMTGTATETPTSGTSTSSTTETDTTSPGGTTTGTDTTSTGEALTEGSTTAVDSEGPTTGEPFVCPEGAGPFIGGPLALTLGEATTIEGCRFGLPKDDRPLVWDDFEGGVAGELLRDHSEWKASSGDGARYTDDDAFSGGLAASNEVFVGSGQSFSTNYQEVPTSEEMYLSYRFRVKLTGNPYGVLKLSRIASNYDGELPHTTHYNGPGSMVWTYQPHAPWSYASYDNGAESVQKTVGAVIHEWHRVEMYIRASTPGEPDGKMWVAQNGQKLWEDDAAITRAADMEYQYHSVLLGLMLANPKEDGHFWLSLDDLFFASSEARVELGDAPVFEDCSDREVQPHVAWTDGSVQITPRLGRLDAGGPLYLFVVDPEGQASAGLQVTVSE